MRAGTSPSQTAMRHHAHQHDAQDDPKVVKSPTTETSSPNAAHDRPNVRYYTSQGSVNPSGLPPELPQYPTESPRPHPAAVKRGKPEPKSHSQSSSAPLPTHQPADMRVRPEPELRKFLDYRHDIEGKRGTMPRSGKLPLDFMTALVSSGSGSLKEVIHGQFVGLPGTVLQIHQPTNPAQDPKRPIFMMEMPTCQLEPAKLGSSAATNGGSVPLALYCRQKANSPKFRISWDVDRLSRQRNRAYIGTVAASSSKYEDLLVRAAGFDTDIALIRLSAVGPSHVRVHLFIAQTYGGNVYDSIHARGSETSAAGSMGLEVTGIVPLAMRATDQPATLRVAGTDRVVLVCWPPVAEPPSAWKYTAWNISTIVTKQNIVEADYPLSLFLTFSLAVSIEAFAKARNLM